MSAICNQDIIEELLGLKKHTIRGEAYFKVSDIKSIVSDLIKEWEAENGEPYNKKHPGEIIFEEDPKFKFKEADPNDDGQIMHPYKDY